MCQNERFVALVHGLHIRSIGGDESCARVLIMSVHRCVYFLTRTHLQRRACAITSRCAAAAVFNPNGHVLGSSSVRRSASSSGSSWRPPDTSLFIPLAVKSDAAEDGAVGAELTRALDKGKRCCVISISQVLVVNDPQGMKVVQGWKYSYTAVRQHHVLLAKLGWRINLQCVQYEYFWDTRANLLRHAV